MRDSELAFTPYINAYHLNAIYDLLLFPYRLYAVNVMLLQLKAKFAYVWSSAEAGEGDTHSVKHALHGDCYSTAVKPRSKSSRAHQGVMAKS